MPGLTKGSDRGPARSESAPVFHPADILYALEWASIAPGLGGWNVTLDNDTDTRLVSVVPPGADHPCFFVRLGDGEAVLAWLRPNSLTGTPVEIGRFASLRAAVQVLCPLDGAQYAMINEAMELLYPRSLRIS